MGFATGLGGPREWVVQAAQGAGIPREALHRVAAMAWIRHRDRASGQGVCGGSE